MGSPARGSVILLLVFSTGVSGQTVIQKTPFALVQEGDSIQLKCSFTGTEYSLQWYKQFPGGHPQFISLLTTSTSKSWERFEMVLDSKEKMTTLLLNKTSLEDSATYFCAMEAQYCKEAAGPVTKASTGPAIEKSTTCRSRLEDISTPSGPVLPKLK